MIENCFTRRIRKQTYVSIIVVRFFIEGCIELGLTSLIAIKMMSYDHFKSFSDAFALIMAFVSVVCLIIAPFYLNYVGKKLINEPHRLSER